MMDEKEPIAQTSGNSSDSMATLQEYGTNLTQKAKEVSITLDPLSLSLFRGFKLMLNRNCTKILSYVHCLLAEFFPYMKGKLDPVIGREKQIERVIQILSRRTKNNPCLIGDPGVGKTSIAEGLALLIASGDVPETIEGKQVFQFMFSCLGNNNI